MQLSTDPPLKLVKEDRENRVGPKAWKGFFQMEQKRHRVDLIISKLRRADVGVGKSKNVPEVCKRIGIVEQTYYRWRQMTVACSRKWNSKPCRKKTLG